MKKTIGLLLVALVLAFGPMLVRPGHVLAGEQKILEFETMVGVPAAYTGTKAPIRGVNGGGVPWVIGAAEGELKQSGKLEVKVTGLVIDPAIANPNAGANPSANFRAIVSCQTVVDGAAAVVNVISGTFPATTGLASAGGGNARIETQLDLPQPCIAPIVFVTSATGSWFAATGY